MRKVILRFKDGRDLRRFVQVTQCKYLEVNYPDLTVVCECEEAEIELAQSAFNATAADKV